MKKYKTSDEEFLNDNDITDQDTDDKINYALAFKSHLQKIGGKIFCRFDSAGYTRFKPVRTPK